MPDQRDQQLPRGVAVSRREQMPPWRVEAGARDHASLHVVVRGSFHLTQGALPAIDLAPGDIVLLPAGNDGEPTLHCTSLPPEPAELLSAAYAVPDAPEALAAVAPVMHLPAGDVQRERGLATIVGLMRAALLDPSPGQERLARSLLDPLFAYLLHCHERAGAGDRAARPAQPADRRIARALQLLRSKPGDRWTVEALARAAGLSRAAFARRFQAEIGVPPLRHLADLRMELAARLLAEGDDTLAAIAAQVGYESEFAFSRAFKRQTGEAPGAFRRRHRMGGAALRQPPIRAAA